MSNERTHGQKGCDPRLRSFEWLAVPGLRSRQSDGVLQLVICDPANRNALRRTALDGLYEACARFHELPFDSLRLEFDTRATSVACAGLNLEDFEAGAREVKAGQDLLGPDHYFVRAAEALRRLSKSVLTAAVVSGHLVGAGVELALSCRQVTCTRPDAKILLPHLRMGVPYYTSGLGVMASILGWDVLSQAMVTDAVPVLVSQVLANRARIAGLSAEERLGAARVALDRMIAVFRGQPVPIGCQLFLVEDRTGKTRHIAEAHILQVMAHVIYGDDIADVPVSVQEMIDAPRIRASSGLENRVPESIAAHRRSPKILNQHFSKSIAAAGFHNPLGEPRPSASPAFGGQSWERK